MNLKQRIQSFVELGDFLRSYINQKNSSINELDSQFEKLNQSVVNSFYKNGWFTEREVLRSIDSWSKLLTNKNLERFVEPYKFKEASQKIVSIIMAGNVPLVGMHDFLCVLLSGNKVLIKKSSQDELLISEIINKLFQINPEFQKLISETSDRLEGMDAVIATGSNNTSRYFEYYFGKYPHIIRKNRNSIAVLDGDESDEDLNKLGEDIFNYYGLGCRNISKLIVPNGYNFDKFYKNIFSYGYVSENNKYINNYQYYKTIDLMNGVPLLDNNFLILKENSSIASPPGVIHFEYYKNLSEVETFIELNNNSIQAVISKNHIQFGKAQSPDLWDYADNVDTLNFLAILARQ